MKDHKGYLSKFPLYVFIFSIYPALTLFAWNVTEVSVANIWRSLAASFFGSVLVFLFIKLVFKDWYLTAIVTTLILLLFFMYGHLYESLKEIDFLVPLIRHRYMIPLSLVIVGIGIWLAIRFLKHPEKWTLLLNLIAFITLLMPVIRIGSHYFLLQKSAVSDRSEAVLVLPAEGQIPDIYYIILDAYGNSETLEELMAYDNSGLLEALRSQGFYVPECSQANYASTQLSLASSLNMDYLNNPDGPIYYPGLDQTTLLKQLKSNLVRSSLESLGYQTIAFETGSAWSEWYDADLYLIPDNTLWSGWNEFEYLLVKTSALRALLDIEKQSHLEVGTSRHYQNVHFVLDSLRLLPSMPGPKFVFVHLLMPHDPFDVDEDGTYFTGSWSSATRETYFEGYRRQLVYISNVMPQITAEIIDNSATPPIIIVQGDHGPSFYFNDPERMGILNAYYYPSGTELFYETITPVNTFRLIFNTTFGGKYEILEDVSYKVAKLSDVGTEKVIQNPCLK